MGWLNRCSQTLGPEEVARIASAAVLAPTWRRRPVEPGNAHALQQNFSALRLLVNQARRRRVAWVLSVPAVAFLMLAGGGPLSAAILHALTGR